MASNVYNQLGNYNPDRDEWEYKKRAMEEMQKLAQYQQGFTAAPGHGQNVQPEKPKPAAHLNKKLLLTKG